MALHILNSLQQDDKDEFSDEGLDELIGLLQEHEITSRNNDEEEEDEDRDGHDEAEDTIFSVSKGHVDGMIGEVDKFMACGGYHVLYIGSVPVGINSC